MNDLQKACRDAKKRATKLMKAGEINAYINQLTTIHQMRKQIMDAKFQQIGS